MNEQWAGANGMFDGSMFPPNNVMQNGAFQQPQYNVNPVVPSKRPRPSEDGAAASPRQPPSHLNLSRSQTPHQPGGFPGFPGQQQQQPHNPYQHLQHGGSNNATPSPTLQDQQFRPPTTAQRMNASPSPFHGGQPGMGMSPPPDANGSRVNTPHNPNFSMGGMNIPPSSMPQAFNPNFGGMAPAQMQGGGMMPSVPLSQNLARQQQEVQRQQQQQQEQENRMYQMRLAQQQQVMAGQNMAGRNAQQMGMMNAMAAMPGQNPNMNTPTRNPLLNQRLQAFVRNLQGFMQQHNRPLEITPVVCGRQIHVYQLYMMVMQHKGSSTVDSKNEWPTIALQMSFPPNAAQQAAQELRMTFQKYLAPYESAYWRSQASKQQATQQMPFGHPGMNAQVSPTKSMAGGGNDMSPQQSMLHHQRSLAQMQQRAQAVQHAQLGQATPVQGNVALPSTNGWSPQNDAANAQRQGSLGAPGKVPKPEPSPLPHPGAVAPPSATTDKFPEQQSMQPPGEIMLPDGRPVKDFKVDHGTNYVPKKYHLVDAHGGIHVKDMNAVGMQIDMLKPVVPDTEEMGLIDVRALCMSLQSGIHGEVRYALDHLIKLSHDPRHILDLERCEDLVDVLIDCAQEQVNTLAEDAVEVSDIVDMTPYEDVIRHCRSELESLQDIPEFASSTYDYDRAADRLIAVTTLLRNISFWPNNHPQLCSEPVIKFLSSTIRLIGTRPLFLRSYTNTQDFMKDVVTFFSNVTDKIELPSREDTLNILHFLLAFAPQPAPTASAVCRFARFNPSVHRYLPPAIDSLAKLLARDDPNRAYYKHVFLNDPASANPKLPAHQQYDLLTRSFALAISVIPDRTATAARGPVPGMPTEHRIAEARKPYLIQGMLAADILATLVPNADTGLACAWLEAEDGWAASLLRLACTLSTDRANAAAQGPPGRPGHPQQAARADHDLGFGLVTHRALGMLQKLGDRTRSELLNSGHRDQQKLTNGTAASGAGGAGEQENGDKDAAAADGGGDGEVDADAATAAAVDVAAAAADESEDDDEKRRRQLLKVLADVLPQREVLLGALLTPTIEAQALKQLCAFAALEV